MRRKKQTIIDIASAQFGEIGVPAKLMLNPYFNVNDILLPSLENSVNINIETKIKIISYHNNIHMLRNIDIKRFVQFNTRYLRKLGLLNYVL